MTEEIQVNPKRIYIFENGNLPEKIFFVHPKCRLSWTSILDFITSLLKPKFGNICCLRNESGTRIITSFKDLEDGGKYIACGNEPFISIPGGYRTESELNVSKAADEATSSEIIRAVGKNVNYLTDTKQINILTIYVFLNGQKIRPKKICLLKSDLISWNNILDIISERIYQDITRLCTIFGEKIEHPEDLQNRGFYVALFDNTNFENIPYLSVFSMNSKRRFRQTRQTNTITKEVKSFKNEVPKEVPGATNKYLKYDEGNRSNKQDCLVNFINDFSENQSLHVTIVQKPFTASKNLPGVPNTVCATRPTAKFILEMMGDNDDDAAKKRPEEGVATQTDNVFVDATPCGKCVIEVGSKKYHVVDDDGAQHLPSGLVFRPGKGTPREICEIARGKEVINLENIANRIVGIVIDASEFVASKSIYGSTSTTNNKDDVEGIQEKNDCNKKLKVTEHNHQNRKESKNFLREKCSVKEK